MVVLLEQRCRPLACRSASSLMLNCLLLQLAYINPLACSEGKAWIEVSCTSTLKLTVALAGTWLWMHMRSKHTAYQG